MQMTRIYIEGFKHTNPIPNAAQIGNIVVSGALMGRDSRTNEIAQGIEAQTALVFRHMCDVIEAAGGTTDDIINSLLKEIRAELDGYQLTRAYRALGDFVVEDLSNWYVRRSRSRFASSISPGTSMVFFRSILRPKPGITSTG